VEFVFGDVYARPGLDAKARQLVTLGSSVSLGDTGVQVRFQVGNALNAGLSEAEITEAILHCAIFAGFARVINAMFVAREVFDEHAAGSASPMGAPPS
jgi:4-carboxymuconolactone decarboxylase